MRDNEYLWSEGLIFKCIITCFVYYITGIQETTPLPEHVSYVHGSAIFFSIAEILLKAMLKHISNIAKHSSRRESENGRHNC